MKYLNNQMGLFLTMNPSLQNKNEMSDNLKALFRPLSIIIPDNKEIAVNILYSEGNI